MQNVNPKPFSVRYPRHMAVENGNWSVSLAVAPTRQVAAQLADFSRQGAKLKLAEPLERGQQLVIHILDADSKLDISIPATVRWRSKTQDRWAVGCSFDEEVSYETFGELFLAGILSPQPLS